MKEFRNDLDKSQCGKIREVSEASHPSRSDILKSQGTGSMSNDNCSSIKNMLNAMLNPVSYKDRNGVYLGVNEIYATQIVGLPADEIIGYTLQEAVRKIVERFPERAFVNGKTLMEQAEELVKYDLEFLKNGEKNTYEYEGLCADGKKRVFLVNKSCFCNEKGEVIGLITVLQDITEYHKARSILQEREEKYRFITEQTEQIIYDFDFKNYEGSLEGAIEEVTGYPAQKFQNISPDIWNKYLHPEDIKVIEENVEKIQKEGGKYRQEFRFRKKDGTYFYAEDRGVCLLDKNGKPYKLLGIIKDVTERKLAHERIQKSEERYRSFIENFKGIAFQADENFIPQFLHGAVEEITGYSEEEFISDLSWKNIVDPEYLPAILEEERKIREVPDICTIEVEFRIKNKKGKDRWVRKTCQKIPGKNGKPEVYQGVIYDITGRKQAEEALKYIEIARKKEIHHRIKNNLQVISSLLDLQAEKFRNREFVKDIEVLEAFRESQNRVISIALIHEELHEGAGTDTLNFSPYLERLVDNLFHTYRLGSSSIILKKDLEKDIFFDMDTAVPLGLIVNELVSNSLKHAFSGRDSGEIRIELHRDKNIKTESNSRAENETETIKNARYILKVSDNGTGIPDTVDIVNSSSLGLQLVNILVAQLDSEIEIKRGNGTEFTIKLNRDKNL